MATHQTSASPRSIRRIGQIDIDVETREGALGRLVDAIQAREAGAWGFCNAHTVNMAQSNREFRAAVQRMTMFNDGSGIDMASRHIYRSSFPENLNGTDLTPALLERLPEGTGIYLVGGEPKTVESAGRAISAAFPNIRVVGWQHGYFQPDESHGIVNAIRKSDARLVLVGMGHPRQEIWAATHGPAIDAPLICVGAMIDRFAGKFRRAPLWVRRLGAEWVFRLVREPRRLAKRYIWGNAVFLYRIERQRAAARAGRN